MICNNKVTIYHLSGLDSNHNEVWTRYNYDNVWFFGGKGAGINKGFENANDVDIRIPYDSNVVDIKNFSLGDIIVEGHLTLNIATQKDLSKYFIYKITSLNNNKFGNNQHIHIGGK